MKNVSRDQSFPNCKSQRENRTRIFECVNRKVTQRLEKLFREIEKLTINFMLNVISVSAKTVGHDCFSDTISQFEIYY